MKKTSTPTNLCSKDEKRWKAESDARAIANARVISADPQRMKAAIVAAKKMAVEASVNAAREKLTANALTRLAKK